ncbi:MAG: hypothetical protein HY390_07140 [Deltaproteobacteria bacterium]|nr:hypothetical protein [Deltaproteobacteria bacterium]
MPKVLKRNPKEVLTVKVSCDIRSLLAQFCEEHNIQIGKFVETSILAAMEDYDDIQWAMQALVERMNEPSINLEEVFRKIKIKH